MKKVKKRVRFICGFLSILEIIIIIILMIYLSKTMDVLNSNKDSKYKTENYSVIVLDKSDYEEIDDIKDLEVGYYKNSTGYEKANKTLTDKVNVDLKEYSKTDTLAYDLLTSNIEVIVIEDSIKQIIEEEIEDFSTSTRVIYTFKVKIETTSTLKEVDVAEETFAVYISGIDTYGEISSVSRSDVNIVALVNPNTYQVLLISIPRDYYVRLHNTTGSKDKLTHAGIYGIDMSINTIEDLLDVEINYYVKVNFSSVIDIVDALGGVEVYSEYTFISYSNYSFKEGMNSVNGEEALDFVRTRKAFVDGDRQRGKNQQALIEAIIKKASSKSIITKYSSLLDAIDGKYQTNMSTKKMLSLVKLQLNKMPTWTVTSYSLEGYDSYNYTYTYDQLLYVMEPDEDSVLEAQNLINEIIGGKKSSNSKTTTSGSVNSVKKVQTSTYINEESETKTDDSNLDETDVEEEQKEIDDDEKELEEEQEDLIEEKDDNNSLDDEFNEDENESEIEEIKEEKKDN